VSESEDLVLFERAGAVATIVLNRPDKLNAINEPLVVAAMECLDEVRSDPAIRAVVLRGAGRAFCSGDDVTRGDRFKYGNPDLQTRKRVGYGRLLIELLELRKPVVAMIRGYAVGAGMDLALGCDFRIAERGAQMGALFVKRGLGGGAAYLLPRFVGLGKATELLLLGELISMDECQRLDLVTKVVEDDELELVTYDFAEKLARGPTASLGAVKNARNQGLGLDPVKGVEWQMIANMELLFYKDAIEGPRAFAERRQPEFTGEWIDAIE
jgi:enoyl-CoA hydratase/carnithine racemase